MPDEIVGSAIELFFRFVVDNLIRGLGYLIRRYIFFQRGKDIFFTPWTFTTGLVGWAIVLFGLYLMLTGHL